MTFVNIIALEVSYDEVLPARGINYSINSAVSVRVYDRRGRELAVLRDGVAGPALDSVDWDVAGVAPGVYTFYLTAKATDGEQASVTKKFAIIK